VRALSVTRITLPTAHDSAGHALPGGPACPRLGPPDSRTPGSCATCGQASAACPGHFGHVELPVPVFHPLLFSQAAKLLAAACQHCGALRAPGPDVRRVGARAALLRAGRVAEALALEAGTAPEASGEGVVSLCGDGEGPTGPAPARSAEAAGPAGPSSSGGGGSEGRESTHVAQARARLLPDLLKACPPGGRCARCGMSGRALKREGPCRLFLSPLGAKAKAANEARGGGGRRGLGGGDGDDDADRGWRGGRGGLRGRCDCRRWRRRGFGLGRNRHRRRLDVDSLNGRRAPLARRL